MGTAEPRFDVDRAQADRPLQRFTEAAGAGDMDGLLAVLAEDITLWADGGGKARGGRPLAAMILHLRGEHIHTIYAIANPEKLQTMPQPQ